MSNVKNINWSKPIEFDGVSLMIQDWARRKGMAVGSLQNRIRRLGVPKALGARRMSQSDSGRRGSSTWRRVYGFPAAVA